jgi:deoxyribodipyrimidine photo-lyase
LILVWLRRDLRLGDHPALSWAVARNLPVLPVYCLPDDSGGGASRWWLHHSLRALRASLEQRGSRLILRRGDPAQILVELAAQIGAAALCWNRMQTPAEEQQAASVRLALEKQGIEIREFSGDLLFEPTGMRVGKGERGYRVFTPYWRACEKNLPVAVPAAIPRHIPQPEQWPASDRLDDWALLPAAPDWAGGLRESWQPGEEGAGGRLDEFLSDAVPAYARRRDYPALDGTSRLSPHLHFGEITARQVLYALHARGLAARGADFVRELGWREFAHHVLHDFPKLAENPMDRRFEAFPWVLDPAALETWQRGRTGYTLVDAGMRELWHTGWMHNRVRMVVASFLVKHLLQPWQAGERWFRDTLVDADAASNAFNWQWVAGCGADAAPYFRIFNPVLQGQKFDPEGDYVRRWVPELARLPARWIHQPWSCPAPVLAGAGVELGGNYPRPVVDHAWARQRALAAFERIKAVK